MEGVNIVDEVLFESSRNGDLEGVMAALAQGGRVAVRMKKYQGHSPLSAAAQNGFTDICCLLLAQGSEMNDLEPYTKQTALHHAAVGSRAGK